jgi:hypothetical protein
VALRCTFVGAYLAKFYKVATRKLSANGPRETRDTPQCIVGKQEASQKWVLVILPSEHAAIRSLRYMRPAIWRVSRKQKHPKMSRRTKRYIVELWCNTEVCKPTSIPAQGPAVHTAGASAEAPAALDDPRTSYIRMERSSLNRLMNEIPLQSRSRVKLDRPELWRWRSVEDSGQSSCLESQA